MKKKKEQAGRECLRGLFESVSVSFFVNDSNLAKS
jgi:hypothetical protein